MVDLISEVGIVNWVKNQKDCIVHTRDFSNINDIDFHELTGTVFVCLTGYQNILNFFFSECVNKINVPFVLIIIESDEYFLDFGVLQNPNLRHIFAWNIPEGGHDKISAIPIGLNHYGQKNSLSNYLLDHKIDFHNRDHWVGVNFLDHTPTRSNLYNNSNNEWSSFCHNFPYTAPLNEYWKTSNVDGKIKISETSPFVYDEMINCKYIMSPPGAGVDCHRTWEALYLDCIPIVEKSPISELYQDLPILAVKDWDDLNFEYLQLEYEKISKRKIQNDYDMNKIKLSYWTHKMGYFLESC